MPPRPPDTFETARTLLRPVSVSDAPAIFEGYSSSPIATRYLTFARHRELRQAVEFAARCVRCWQDGTAYAWAIVSKVDGTFIGAVELRIDLPDVDLGYVLVPAFWGRGHATEAARPLVDWAFSQPDVSRFWATCHPDNAASIRVLEKLGLARERREESGQVRPQLSAMRGPDLIYARQREQLANR